MSTPYHPATGINGGSRVYADQFSDGLRKQKYMLFERIANNPLIMQHGTQAAPVTVPTVGTAVQDNIDTMYVPGAFGNKLIEFYQTTAQTLFPSRHATKGLSIGCDLVDNESVEYVPGGNHAANPLGYLAGTDGGVFMRLTVEITDVSGEDQLIFGYRKQEAYVVPTSFLSTGDALYTDFIGIGFSGSANPNDLKVVWDQANGGSTFTYDTGFNWADTLVHTIEIQIKGRRSRFLLNGRPIGDTIRFDGLGAAITAQNTSTPTVYTVTSGLFMVPFWFVRHDTTTPGTIFVRKCAIGQLLEDGLDPAGRGSF